MRSLNRDVDAVAPVVVASQDSGHGDAQQKPRRVGIYRRRCKTFFSVAVVNFQQGILKGEVALYH